MTDNRNSILPLSVAPERDIAAAVLVAEDGRYLMQLRDDRPVHLPEHWTLFGGGLDPGEDPETALRRELAEELTWTAREVEPLLTSAHSVGANGGLWRLHFFTVPFTPDDLAAMIQTEGADKRVMSLSEICQLERIGPWDLCAILIHGRRRALFG